MTLQTENRPGTDSETATAEQINSLSIAQASDRHAEAVTAVSGTYVAVVTTPQGRTRRHAYWNLPGAQKAVDRATAAGNLATIMLCQLVPVAAGAEVMEHGPAE